jgi:hypothetical protein
MGTTTNYAIPYPEPTDFVTDGATAMESIAEQVDAQMFATVANRNLLYNGAMQISQRSSSAVTGITSSGYYTLDRWKIFLGTAGTWTQTPDTDNPSGQGFRRSLKMTCTTADASLAAGDFFGVHQLLEGQDLQAIRKGTASAQPVTLSFWVKTNKSGTYICELRDNDNNRSVSKSYVVNATGTWEYKTVTFPADTTGMLDNDSSLSLEVNWWLAAGTTYSSGTLQTTWATVTSANRAVGQVNLASDVNNYWQVTGTQFTIGSVASPFQFKNYGQDLNECMRFYQVWSNSSNTNFMTIGSFVYSTPMSLAVPMRTLTTTSTTFVGTVYGQSGSYALTTLNITIHDASRPQYFTLSGTFSGSWNYSWPVCTFNTHTCIFDGELV